MGIEMLEEYLEQSIFSIENVLELNNEVDICRPHKMKLIDSHLRYAKDESNELARKVESINKALDQVNEELFNFLREGKNCIVPQFQLTSALSRLIAHPKNLSV